MRNFRSSLAQFLLAFSAYGIAFPLVAQERLSAPRADGQSTPILVYRPGSSGTSCPPLALISHGAGGSENGYRYLATAMSGMGYTAIVMGHRESGMPALTAAMRRNGVRDGIRALVVDTEAEQSRLLDVAAALEWSESRCHAPFRVLLGHSMGSETVMLEAGARNIISVKSPPAGQDRFDAYVALSPEGSGVVFPRNAWSAIRKPILILTGTRDQALNGGPETRQEPWQGLPGIPSRCQWLGVVDGATHMNFAGSGLGRQSVEPQVTTTISSFLSGVGNGHCTLPPQTSTLTLKSK
jgi:predicted dienelactone hydrolase